MRMIIFAHGFISRTKSAEVYLGMARCWFSGRKENISLSQAVEGLKSPKKYHNFL